MPLYGPCGQHLKVSHRRKSLRDLRKRKRRIGSALGVKRGLKNASENAMPDDRKLPHEPSSSSIARWLNEGVAPKCIDLRMRRSFTLRDGTNNSQKTQ